MSCADADRANTPASVAASAPVLLDEGMRLSPTVAEYLLASRSESTRRGYRSDLRDWAQWCQHAGIRACPASSADVAEYIAYLADAGAKVGTIRRRLSTLSRLHDAARVPNPCADLLVTDTLDGIRHKKGAPPDQAVPLRPPVLWNVLDACPRQRVWADPKRRPEPHLLGHRDRALLLVGYVGALRRSELAAIRVVDLVDHRLGITVRLPRSKTNQTGEQAEFVILPRAVDAERCPVQAVLQWLEVAGIDRTDEGPFLRPVGKSNRAVNRHLSPASINALVQQAITRAGHPAGGYSAHSLRAGFVTEAHLSGASDRQIARQTRHRSPASVSGYIRLEQSWRGNAALHLSTEPEGH